MPLQGEYEPPARDWVRQEVDRILSTGTTDGTTMSGYAVVLVTTVGAQSGKLRKVPLIRVEHEDEYALIASKGGAPDHPQWYYNVKANPHVELQDGALTMDYLAREATGEERDLWWHRATQVYRDYTDYQAKTDRQIPVFVLTPMSS
ncbi:nitroreductase family deazaflavin-dependent oxidoreductase [Enemella sp. A6]|uniref:nitroreductase family deazaflavin-dependent oxidoreductase n=1 Tax=Enemella sp. A6 TaxID=3440152 RepID=UPI003EBC582B